MLILSCCFFLLEDYTYQIFPPENSMCGYNFVDLSKHTSPKHVLSSHLQKVIVMTEPLSIIKLDVVSSGSMFTQISATVVPTKSDIDVCFVLR